MDTASADRAAWFYEEEGQRKGPVTEAVMLGLIHAKRITYGSLVWQAGFPEWLKAEDTTLRPHLEAVAPPPLAGKHVGNGVVWVLALAPIIGYLLEIVMAYALSDSDVAAQRAIDSNRYWYATIALNIGLSYFDERRLQRAGYDTTKFRSMTWLVPIYLYQRAKALNQNLAYFVVWIVGFVLTLFS